MHLTFLPPAEGLSPLERGAHWFLWGIGDAGPGTRHLEPLRAAGRPASARLVTGHLAVEPVDGLEVPLGDGLPLLARLGGDELERVPASVAAWSLAAKFALELVSRERIVPWVRRRDGAGESRWGVSLSAPGDAERFTRLARSFPPAAHAVPIGPSSRRSPTARRPRGSRVAPGEPPRVWAPEALLAVFLDAAADLLATQASPRTPVGRAGTGARRWESRLVAALTGGARSLVLEDESGADLGDELARWAEPARGAPGVDLPRLCLKLDAPGEEGGSPGPRAWRLHYFLQAPDDPSLLLPASRVWASASRRLDWMDRGFTAPQETLLERLGEAARLFPPIERSLESPCPESAELSTDEAWHFLSEAAPAFGEAGVGVLLPAELSPSGQRRLRLRMLVGGRLRGPAGAVSGAARLGLDSLLGYRWELALGDEPLSRAQFDALVRLKRPLVRWRGQWVLLDPAETAELERLLAEGGGRLAAGEALAAALAGTLPREPSRAAVRVVAEGSLASLVDRLRAGIEPAAPPADLEGRLRPYQERGLGWLSLMAGLGLGSCLADDMGLGKTVQLIAFLLARRARHPDDPRPALIVCPTSVVGNWERELARFAPTLPVCRHHGPDRTRDGEALRALPPHAVVVTTYALLRRDQALLEEIDWAVAALDEAQNIKNAASHQARAARAVRASHRFALTGTPVENRLAELWSVLEFCVPGLLGSLERFRRRFALPIERYRDEGAARELRGIVGPFLLRRTKSDPAVAADLPPKQEMPVICTLTREQATLYQAALDEAMIAIGKAEGIQRRGRVLALLTALKQICNHPAHYLREPGPLPGRSGKLDRLTEMLEETVAGSDRALVFTQFREMGARLVTHLERALDAPVLFLHGGVPRGARDDMVRRFQEDAQAPSVFVLSLKAGGTGLNLTQATRVFHFDRWWNPAVEDQATDRAHRIGQHRVVQVYRLLAAGTVEERIDALLADKRALADRIVGAGETWITELSDAELGRLLALSVDAPLSSDEDALPPGEDNGRPAPARVGRAQRSGA